MTRTILSAFTSAVFYFSLAETLCGGWQDDYAVAGGFRLEVDSEGYHFPTSIAFVPNPGNKQDSPLYFVAEIRGRLKVVTNDRTVSTFAEDFFNLRPLMELPEVSGEIGMAGLFLDPENGYIFVSYAYEDDQGLYRNGISRFQSVPGVFSLRPISRLELAPFLKQYLSSVSHQIGPMAIHDGLLYVCVGDGEVSQDARNLDSPAGKVLRMTLDGLPAPGNPFSVDRDPLKVRNFVWARGLRNPFSLKIVEGRVFVADNGPQVDRFIEVRAGDDFLYDGSNESIASNPLFLWSKAVSPVQMDYNPALAQSLGFPAPWKDSFILTLSGTPSAPEGESDRGAKSVVALGVDLKSGRVIRPPKNLLTYVGAGKQMPVGAAFGPDGLYVVPLFDDSEGRSVVLKLSYDPARQHPTRINDLDPDVLLHKHACLACHMIDGKGYGEVAPEIFRYQLMGKLLKRLNSAEYSRQLEAIDSLDEVPFTHFSQAREAVRNAEGEKKVRIWLKNRLMEPRFDQQVIAMPNLGISEEEAVALGDWLLATDAQGPLESIKAMADRVLPKSPAKRHLMVFLFGGLAGTGAGWFLVYLVRRK